MKIVDRIFSWFEYEFSLIYDSGIFSPLVNAGGLGLFFTGAWENLVALLTMDF